MATAWPWFLDRVLPGLIVAVIAAGGHYLLTRRHLSRITDRQTAHFDEKTDAQTAQIHAARLDDGEGRE